MWPLPSTTRDHLSIIFEPARITCCAIAHTSQSPQLILNAYEELPLANNELISLVMTNPTRIGNFITTFIRQHAIKSPTISCSLSGDGLYEVFQKHHNSEQKKDFFNTYSPALFSHKSIYLYPDDEGFVFYECAIAHAIKTQYTLWALRHHLPLIALMSGTASVLSLYKHIYGAAYRPAQLAAHMKQKNNDITLLFSSDLLERILHMPKHQFSNDHYNRLTLFKACGLFVTKGTKG